VRLPLTPQLELPAPRAAKSHPAWLVAGFAGGLAEDKTFLGPGFKIQNGGNTLIHPCNLVPPHVEFNFGHRVDGCNSFPRADQFPGQLSAKVAIQTLGLRIFLLSEFWDSDHPKVDSCSWGAYFQLSCLLCRLLKHQFYSHQSNTCNRQDRKGRVG